MSDNRRYYGLDALRGSMMLLGIVLHSAGFYLTSPPPAMAGFPTDRSTSYLFDLVFHFIHSFRMPLFFVLGGFFASLLVEKRGLWGTYKDRAARVLAPMLVAVFTILPIGLFFVFDFMIAARYGVMEIVPDRARLQSMGRELQAAGAAVDKPSILHLWFLLYLCYFYLTMPACRWLVEASLSRRAAITKFLASPFAFVFFSLYTAGTLWPFHGGQVHEGFLYLEPHVPSLVYYGSFFVFGFFFHTYRDVLKAFVRFAPAAAILAAVLFPVSLWLSFQENNAVGLVTGWHLGACIVHGFCTWALIYAFAGGVLRFFDHESAWILYISQSAYWVYLVHMVFVAIAAWLIALIDWPAIVKFAFVAIFTTIGSFASYHYLVQRTWVSRFLHGRRFDLDWPWRATRTPPKAAVDA